MVISAKELFTGGVFDHPAATLDISSTPVEKLYSASVVPIPVGKVKVPVLEKYSINSAALLPISPGCSAEIDILSKASST